MFKPLTIKARRYKIHTTWGMHKHNPRVLLVNKPTGELVPFLTLPTAQFREYVRVCGHYIVDNRKAAS
jgi:hypothetical protein